MRTERFQDRIGVLNAAFNVLELSEIGTVTVTEPSRKKFQTAERLSPVYRIDDERAAPVALRPSVVTRAASLHITIYNQRQAFDKFTELLPWAFDDIVFDTEPCIGC